MKVSILATLVTVPLLLIQPVLASDGGKHGNDNNQNNAGEFSSAIVGSSPGTTIGGVASGGAPWVVAQGNVEIGAGSQLELRVTGLLLGPGAPANLVGTVGPVQMVAASVVCGGSGGTVAASTAGVPLNASGNASIESSITLPAKCVAPVVIVRIFNPAGAQGQQLGAFIAATGIVPGANPGQIENEHDGNDH